MRYAKLINGGIVSSNAPKSGYKPFAETVPESRDGYNSYAEYVDDGDAITTIWHYTEQTDQEKENPEPTHIPAWDISQAEYFNVGDLVTRDGVTYRCTSGHYAAWSKQPPNDSYWEVADNDSIT